jgi:hypothetical protein
VSGIVLDEESKLGLKTILTSCHLHYGHSTSPSRCMWHRAGTWVLCIGRSLLVEPARRKGARLE